MIKHIVLILVTSLTLMTLVACDEPISDDDLDVEGAIPISDIDHNVGRIPAPDAHLYDDFSAGLSPDKWLISNRNWSPQVSQGQKTDNVHVTNDGFLVLEAHGLYHPDPLKQMTGSAILTPDTLGPGRYEVAMKVHPRLGVCTAMWTYYYESDRYNHEIDIEFPGQQSLRNVMNTSWLGVSGPEHTNVIIETDSPANDGQWHVYTFEWHTEPEIIRFYVDGVLTSEITENVPFADGQFWLGAWFPNQWAGKPDFETDYMLVDWFSYEPFDQPSTATTPSTSQVGTLAQYPSDLINVPARNYVSNGNFESNNDAWHFSGDVYFTNRIDGVQSRRLTVDSNGSASQIITAVYDNYHFGLEFDSEVFRGDTGQVVIDYLDINNDVIGNETYQFTNIDELLHVLYFTTDVGTEALRISFESIDGSLIFIDNVNLKLQKK